MANPQLRALYASLALATVACDARPDQSAQSSITVKLPPARPHTAAPAFSFKASGKAAQQSRF
jgi:hypothetical protein